MPEATAIKPCYECGKADEWPQNLWRGLLLCEPCAEQMIVRFRDLSALLGEHFVRPPAYH